MARTNTALAYAPALTHEGGQAHQISSYKELRRSVLTCMLFEDTFYEKGSDIAARIAGLIPKVDPAQVADLAIEARSKMQLRHVPLFLISELSKVPKSGTLVSHALEFVIQRADELTEFLAIYWQYGARSGKPGKHPLSAGVKRGLAAAYRKFSPYALAKYNRDNAIKMRDPLFLVHAKPKDEEQAATWKKLVDGSLESPDTWEVALSAGANKKETFERLMTEGKLGGLAVLRNLRNMQQEGVDETLIRARLDSGIHRALPFRFVVAARYAPAFEDAIEAAMLKGISELESLPGKTGLLIDVSGSMDAPISIKAKDTTRVDVAGGQAILLREKAESVRVATFSEKVVEVPGRRGFALRDAVKNSQTHGGTYLRKAIETLKAHWRDLDRLIVITDEQSHDGGGAAFTEKAYVVNVAPYKNGVSYRDGWTHIDGWSERVIDYVRELESEQ